METQKKLPGGWKWVKLGEICEVVTGTTPPKSNPKNYGNDIPFFKPPDLWDNYVNDTITKLSIEGGKKARVVPANTVLVTCIGNLGRTGFTKKVAAFNQQINAILENEDVTGKYLFYQAQSPLFRKQLEELATGTTVSIVNKGNFETITIPISDISIQNKVVSKIEELFSELDKGIENLRLAQQQLKTYRQAVLKWAFEGRLTNEHVKEGELPKGWYRVQLGTLINNINSGKSFKCDERPPTQNEVGIVKVSSVSWGEFDESESKTCFSHDSFNANYLIKKNDFLFSRANTIELIGACVIVKKVDKKLMLSDKILRFSFTDDVIKEYVLYYLRSRQGRKSIEASSTGNQDSMRNIGQERIRQINLPYCDTDKQKDVVQAIGSRLTIADNLEQGIQQSLQQAEALRQSILKHAFEGKLVSEQRELKNAIKKIKTAAFDHVE